MGMTAAVIGGTALVAGAGISAYASSKAAKAQAKGAGKAADAQVRAAEIASETQLEMWGEARKDVAPWRETGADALAKLHELTDAGPGEFTESPGYKFRLAEGEKAINRASAARGGYFAPATTKRLTEHGQGLATSEYDKFLARYYQKLTPWAGMASAGLNAATMSANASMDTGGNLANIQIGAGEAIANKELATGQSRASNYINLANTSTNMLNQGAMLYGAYGGGGSPRLIA